MWWFKGTEGRGFGGLRGKGKGVCTGLRAQGRGVYWFKGTGGEVCGGLRGWGKCVWLFKGTGKGVCTGLRGQGRGGQSLCSPITGQNGASGCSL